MSPLVQAVYLLIIESLDNTHLNILLRKVAQKPKGITSLSNKSPEILRKKVLECLQKSSNRDNIFLFLTKSGLHDIVEKTKIEYDRLNMSNYETYLEELEKNSTIPAIQGILFIIENGGKERINSFFSFSKENVKKFLTALDSLNLNAINSSNNTEENIEKSDIKLKKELENIKKEYSELQKSYNKIEKNKKELNMEINRLKQKFELEVKQKLTAEKLIKKKEIESIKMTYESLINQRNEQVDIQINENLKKNKKISDLQDSNEQLSKDLFILENKYEILSEKINKKRILLLGDVMGIDLDGFSDKYFDVITVADLNVKIFEEVYEKNKYDEIWIVDFQVSRSLQRELKTKYANEKFKQIKDNSAFY